MRRFLMCLALFGAWPLMTARAALPPLPLMNGTLSGVWHLDPSAPVLAWRMTLRPANAGVVNLEFSVEGQDAHLDVQASLDPVTGDGTWQIAQCRLDLASWSAALTENVPSLASWQFRGTLAIEGHGTIKQGVFDGTATLELADGGMENTKKKSSCDGLALRITLAGLQPLCTEPDQVLSVRTAQFGGVELHDTKISFGLTPDGQVHVGSLESSGLGGTFSAEPFTFALKQPSITWIARARRIDLAQLRDVVDPGHLRINQAAGHVSGRLTVHLDHGNLTVGQSGLALNKGETAQVVLQPSPGLFSRILYRNKKIRVNYPGLAQIELGKMPLVMKTFRIRFYPDGEQASRTILIQLEGGSADPKYPAPVVIDINVHGPVQQLLHGAYAMRRQLQQ
ncbi:MAG TPA: YdbH domain-containing protein [Opitutaceae bacterium]|nr:YdbH domain-containing protein [Opitutaceae bacterium]